MTPTMGPKEVHNRIKEFGNIRRDAGRNQAALLEVALFVEDVFGLFLSDAEICEDNLGTHQDTENFVLKKLDPSVRCNET